MRKTTLCVILAGMVPMSGNAWWGQYPPPWVMQNPAQSQEDPASTTTRNSAAPAWGMPPWSAPHNMPPQYVYGYSYYRPMPVFPQACQRAGGGNNGQPYWQESYTPYPNGGGYHYHYRYSSTPPVPTQQVEPPANAFNQPVPSGMPIPQGQDQK